METPNSITSNVLWLGNLRLAQRAKARNERICASSVRKGNALLIEGEKRDGHWRKPRETQLGMGNGSNELLEHLKSEIGGRIQDRKGKKVHVAT